MSTETERIKKLFRNSWDGPMWHGTNLKEVLKEITWQKAFEKREEFTHNIYEYVMHMLSWRTFVLEHLNGNTEYKLEMNSEQDWIKEYEPNEITWQKALAGLEAGHNELLKAFENVNDSQLNELVPGKKFRWYVFLHGVIHHDIYHSAQISLLKK